LARYVAENFDNLPKPYRSYRHGWVFRNEKPGPGRFRQFMQFDADTVGSASPAADAEMCMMAADAMEALGIRRGSYVVKVNNRKVLDGVMESIGLSGDENVGRRLTVLRAVDKLDKFAISEVEKLLGPGRWDGGEEGKGDFTKGAELSEKDAHAIATCFGDPARADEAAFGYLFESDTVQKARAELREISELLIAGGYESDRIRIDPSVVRGLEYYTGPVYEVELLLETNDDKGRPVRFGSVGGGGRYDGLVSRFRGEQVPATGFSIGVSRLQAALTLIGKLNTRPAVGPVVVTAFDRDRLADYQKMVAQLRSVDIRAELYLGNPKSMGNQLKYADKRNSPCVIIQGSDEKNDPEGPQIIVKDLILGAELAALEKDRDEYLQKQGDAQRKVPQYDLIDEVRRILLRHDIDWK
jgi:histidyl-tRNA synthetase